MVEVLVSIGQVYADNDSREKRDGKRQELWVKRIDGDFAYLWNPEKDLTSRVRLTRLESKDYRLVDGSMTTPGILNIDEVNTGDQLIRSPGLHEELYTFDGAHWRKNKR